MDLNIKEIIFAKSIDGLQDLAKLDYFKGRRTTPCTNLITDFVGHLNY